MDKLLTLKEVAASIGLPESTLRAWRLRGGGPPSAKLGRRVVYREAEIKAWVDAQFAAARAEAS